MAYMTRLLAAVSGKIDKNTATIVVFIVAASVIFFTYRDSKGLEYKDIIGEYKEQLDNYKTALEDCVTSSQMITEQTYEIRIEEAKRMHYKYTSFFPTFVKKVYHPNREPVMIHVNDHYRTNWIYPLSKEPADYIGRTDIEYWGETIGKEFLKYDKIVIKSKVGMDIDVPDPITGEILRVILAPVLYKGEVVQINGEVIFPRKNK
jgi:hypothetical protein